MPVLSLKPTPLISVAPMMEWTDRHDRYFLRLIAPQVILYTEMVTAAAILHGDRDRLLGFDAAEQPVVLQLGGSNPVQLAAAAKIGINYGYSELNLNCGCPSDRVQEGQFGACLMAAPARVADCVRAMREAVEVPLTIKTRIGIDDQDSYQFLCDFVGQNAAAGVTHFIIHARKAWLNGLSPRENREVPPLDYARVYQLKQDFPHLTISLNGGVKTVTDIKEHLQHVDGVMIGREAYQNPWFLYDVETEIFGMARQLSRHDIIYQFMNYVDAHLAEGVKLSAMTRHILGLFQHQRGGRAWRRYLSEHAHLPQASSKVVLEALRQVKA